jgi:colicin import membrane protein
MTAAAALPAGRDPLLPRQPGSIAGPAAMALAAHLGLVLALAAAVNWRTQAPAGIASAELWAAVPSVAPAPAPAVEPPAPAPTPVPPPTPAPQPKAAEPRPDIAIERERERERTREKEKEREADRRAAEKAARDKAEAEAKTKAEAAAAEARLAAQRAENLRRMMGQAGGAASAPTPSTGSAAPSSAYTARLVAAIRANLVYAGSPPGNPTAEVEVRAGPSGTILSRRLVRSSGVAEWDDAVLRAIDRTSALPRDTDGRVPPVLIVAFKFRE